MSLCAFSSGRCVAQQYGLRRFGNLAVALRARRCAHAQSACKNVDASLAQVYKYTWSFHCSVCVQAAYKQLHECTPL